MRNNREPRILPCGTPTEQPSGYFVTEPSFMTWVLPLRQDLSNKNNIVDFEEFDMDPIAKMGLQL